MRHFVGTILNVYCVCVCVGAYIHMCCAYMRLFCWLRYSGVAAAAYSWTTHQATTTPPFGAQAEHIHVLRVYNNIKKNPRATSTYFISSCVYNLSVTMRTNMSHQKNTVANVYSGGGNFLAHTCSNNKFNEFDGCVCVCVCTLCTTIPPYITTLLIYACISLVYCFMCNISFNA